MKSTLNEGEFIDGMRKHVSWETETLRALFEWLEEFEDGTGEEMEFDPVGLRCDFSEYDSLKEINEEYNQEFKTIDELRDHTAVIEVNIPQYYESEQNVSKILIQDF